MKKQENQLSKIKNKKQENKFKTKIQNQNIE